MRLKITVNPDHAPTTYCFDSEVVIVGDGSPESVHICFPSEGLHKNHVKFLYSEGAFWVINQAQDPFVSLNGHPFGRKKIEEKDRLQIRDHVLQIDEIGSKSLQENSFQISPSKEKEITSQNYQEPDQNFPDLESLANDDNPEAWFPQDIKTLESSLSQKGGRREEKPSSTSDFSAKISPLVEEAYNLEEHKPTQPSPQKPHLEKKDPKKLFKIVLLSLFLITALISLVGLEVIFRMKSVNEKEEMLAAESLLDYAMALTYAKVYHVAPQKSSWIDPQFIKNNLVDLLSTTSIPCGNIDTQGKFVSCPYLLRFYTNKDFSRFLLIAQPIPSLTQWLIPKHTLIVDSSLMDLRQTSDLQVLNRLLSKSSPLDGTNGDEIAREIKKEAPISLYSLAKATGQKEFAPPRALSYIKPDAENLIYNAPRYHQFSESFLKKILTIVNDSVNPHEIAIMQSELDTLSKFHDLIFYSSEGMQQAILGYRALRKLVLSSNYFTGYLLFSEEGNITNSHLVIDSEVKEPEEEVHIAERDVEPIPVKPPVESNEVKLRKILEEENLKAQHVLRPLFLKMNDILEEAIQKDSVYLNPDFQKLSKEYTSESIAIQKQLHQSVEEFKRDTPELNDLVVERLLREYGFLDIYLTKMPEKKKKIAKSPYKISLNQQWAFLNLAFRCNQNQSCPLMLKKNAFIERRDSFDYTSLRLR